MLRNYLKIAIRNIFKTKGYSLINVSGLAIGLTCCILLLIYVQDELSFDSFHSKGDRIYRLNKIVTPQTGGTELHAITSGLMGPTLVRDYVQVESSVRVLPWFSDVLMTHKEMSLKLSDVVIADSNFFEVFDFELVRGDPRTALVAPLSLVITEATASRFFGNSDPMGQTLIGLNDHIYTVTGISKDAPSNSHLHYNALISWNSTVPGVGPLSFAWLNRWITQVNMTYLVLTVGSDAADLERKLPEFMISYMPQRIDQYELYLQPFQDIHLRSSNIRYSDRVRLGNINYVYLFSVIAGLILLIACINFMNLATARASKRAKEVGVRKVLGAFRRQLSRQFLGESVLFSVLALVIAGTLVEVLMPSFNSFTGKELQFAPLGNPLLFWGAGLITLFVGVISGSYPALVLSRFQPVETLKGTSKGESKGEVLRKILVASQFAISIALIAGMVVVYQQMQYLRDKDLGFRKDQIVVLPIGDTAIGNRFAAFKQELLQHPNIVSAAGSNSVPGESMMSFSLRAEGKPETENWTAHSIRVDDYDLLKTYGFEMAAGRYFSPDHTTDVANAVVMNESLAKSLGWDDPVGKRLDILGELDEGTVIGVIKDFHMRSLHHAIEPIAFYFAPRFENLSLRIAGGDIRGTIAHLQETWEAFEARYPFEYYFLDQRLEQFYKAEQRLIKTFGLFSALAIIIACLGLFGLAAYTAEQRTKEIGVRKVLGASITNIFYLVSKDFGKLVIIGFVVGAPLAYVGMRTWLQDFAFRTNLGVQAFVLAGMAALLIATLTVAYQAIKAATANPIESLRYE
jgi:putative ABC transport system permease protein